MTSDQPAPEGDRLKLSLDGFEGPLDLLLDLARAQKIDLAKISILALVDQYLAIVEDASSIRLELAADWLVMAAWLAWLKSRLLLPQEDPLAPEGEAASDLLALRLRDLEEMRQAAGWLAERPQLRQDIFPRGTPENLTETDRSKLVADLPSLLRAYVQAVRKIAGRSSYEPRQLSFWTVQDAMRRLADSLGAMPGWSDIEKFLPAHLTGQLRSAAVASTLIASLELARGGTVTLRQDAPFAPILLSATLPKTIESTT